VSRPSNEVGWWTETSWNPHRETFGDCSETRIHALEMSTWRMDIAGCIWFWFSRRPVDKLLSIELTCTTEKPQPTSHAFLRQRWILQGTLAVHPELIVPGTYCPHVRLWRSSRSLRVNSERLQICGGIRKMKRHVGPYHLRRMGRVVRPCLRVACQSPYPQGESPHTRSQVPLQVRCSRELGGARWAVLCLRKGRHVALV
jgi:hypothetical protein